MWRLVLAFRPNGIVLVSKASDGRTWSREAHEERVDYQSLVIEVPIKVESW